MEDARVGAGGNFVLASGLIGLVGLGALGLGLRV